MSDRKFFNDSITPLPDQPGLTARGYMVNAAQPEDANEKMNVLFSLAMPDDKKADLEARVAKGEVVPPEALRTEYAPNADDVRALVSWLESEGFQDVHTSPNGTAVYASATAGQVSRSLQVNMVRVTRDGVTYTAAKDVPSLPSEVAGSVHAIIGLQPFRHANKLRILPGNRRRDREATRAATPAPPTPAIDNAPPYLVSEILKAYNADGLSVNGKGQTIAIMIDTFPNDSDLTAFWAKNNLNISLDQIQKINVNNVQQLPAVEGEETLDASWSSGIASGATIRIYASGSLDFVDLDKTLDAILSDIQTIPGMRQLSVSLGLGETYMGGPTGQAATQHQKYLRLAAAGVNVFVSSGDAGSNPAEDGHSSTGPLQVEYAASDTAVIGVGGTSLVLAANGTVSSETGWVSGGGGESTFFDRQSWQTGNGVPAGNQRLVPDVSLTADPNNGVLLILNGAVNQFGGTSLSAPVWAAFCALCNQARVDAGKSALGFLNPLIYPLLGTSAFRDIVSGSNGAYTAGPGYDMVTGIGVPDVGALISALVALP
jgi:kumamolisin